MKSSSQVATLLFAASSLTMLGCNATGATPAAAQSLLPLPASLVITISAPPSGAAVRGPTAVNAEVSLVGGTGLSGVQFKMDGGSIGAEDTSPPYSVSWDTTSTNDGWHTLTAVARNALGAEFTSDPIRVTVNNSPAPPAAVTRFEETSANVTYGAGWSQRGADWWGWSAGGAAQASTPGGRATFAFNGPSATWIGYRSGYSGIARVFVDGVHAADIDLFARTDEVSVPVFTASGLSDGPHTLAIEATGTKNAEAVATVVLVDAFDVPGLPVSRLQDTDPDAHYTAGWTASDTSKSWSSRYATLTNAAGARASLTFEGTSISWIGYRGPETGIANVYVDGILARTVDTYSPNQKVQDSLFSVTGLADAAHTLTIEATARANPSSSGAWIAVDAFDVTLSGTRHEESDSSAVYTGDWFRGNHNRAWSGGVAAESQTAGARTDFTFTGNAVRWIGLRGPQTGIANVYLDGALLGEVDTHAASEGFQDTVLELQGLAYGQHTLTIEVTGRKNPAATNYWVVVDSFDVLP
ncbi:MAG TPA: Ig-like domain-containing protein [Steroidobacteraceae bacterium]|nr:Ig-like domain-containing protein [Steroidobacteraceae bacterium]